MVSVLNQHKATRHLEKGSYEIYSINIHTNVVSLIVTQGIQTNQQHTISSPSMEWNFSKFPLATQSETAT